MVITIYKLKTNSDDQNVLLLISVILNIKYFFYEINNNIPNQPYVLI